MKEAIITFVDTETEDGHTYAYTRIYRYSFEGTIDEFLGALERVRVVHSERLIATDEEGFYLDEEAQHDFKVNVAEKEMRNAGVQIGDGNTQHNIFEA